MLTPLDARYTAISLPPHPAQDDLACLLNPYRAMIVTQFRAILDRTERSEHYPWIDTKINLITGDDLPASHPLLGRDLVSGWVQGRGLEALSTFAAWLARFAGDSEVDRLIVRAKRLGGDLLGRLGQARAVNGGHLHFFMDPGGQALGLGPAGERSPLRLDASSPQSYSDLFCAKGMYAAASLLGDENARRQAREFCLEVSRGVLSRSFSSDQPQPPTGARAWLPGANSHGPAMISLGLAALFARHEPGPESVTLGLALARYVLETHVNLDARWPVHREYDLVEFVDDAGEPWEDEAGRVISDPGHSLEFVGLFLKFSQAVRRYGGATEHQAAILRRMERLMPGILRRAFENGYQPLTGGICKTVDLVSRRPVDDTMPWWSLPETIRAALLSMRVAEREEDHAMCLDMVAQVHNAFVAHYVRPENHLMAVKVRDVRGAVVDLMPSVPDADPGYHTALCLIDALDAC